MGLGVSDWRPPEGASETPPGGSDAEADRLSVGPLTRSVQLIGFGGHDKIVAV